MCFSNGRFYKRHASNPTQNPDVGEWLRSVKSDKHSIGPLPPALPVPPVMGPRSVDMKESSPPLGTTAPTIIIERPDNMRIEFNANGVKDPLSTALVDTPIGGVGGKAERVKGITCEVQKIEDRQDEESVDTHPVKLDVSAECSRANIAEGKSLVKVTEETAESGVRIKITTGEFDATGSRDQTTHVAGGGGQEDGEENAGSASFSGFSCEFTRADGSGDGSESNTATLEISGQWVQCAKEVESTEVKQAAIESIEMGVAKVSRKRVGTPSLDPGPIFDFSGIGEVEMPDFALFHDMYASPIWSGGAVTGDPGILLARSGDYQRYGLEPPEDCIKDGEDTPELTYTTDGMAITPALVERCIRLREQKTRNEPQSYYPTPQSTPNYDSRGKRLDSSGGGRHYENESRRRHHMPAALTPESRLCSSHNSAPTLTTNPYFSSQSDKYRTPRSCQLGSSASLTPAKSDGNHSPISNLSRGFGFGR